MQLTATQHAAAHCETWAAGVDILTSNPVLHFFSFEPIFWSDLYRYVTVTTCLSNGTERCVIWEPCTSNAETDAYV